MQLPDVHSAMTQLNIREDKKLSDRRMGVMIPNFTSVLPIATNSSRRRGSLPTRAHGSRSFVRSRGASCATLTRTPLRRSLSAMVGMSFSATRVPSKPNLSTQKLHRPLHVHTRTRDEHKCRTRLSSRPASVRRPGIACHRSDSSSGRATMSARIDDEHHTLDWVLEL